MTTPSDLEAPLLECLDVARSLVAREMAPRLERAVSPEQQADVVRQWQAAHVSASEPFVRALARLRALSLPAIVLEVPR